MSDAGKTPEPLGGEAKRVKSDEGSTSAATWTSNAVNFGEVPSWLAKPSGEDKKEAVPAWLSKGPSAFGSTSGLGSTAASFGSSPATFGGTATFGSKTSTFGASFGQAASFGSLAGGSVFGSANPSATKKKSASKKSEDGEESESSVDEEGDEDNGSDGDENEPTEGHAQWGVGTGDDLDLPPPSEVASGEENEKQVYQVKVKLFKLQKQNDKATWAELGSGPLRVNVPRDDLQLEPGAPNSHPRVIVRREGVLKLLLNAAILPEMTLEPVGDKMVRFACESFTDDNPKGTIASFLVKCSRSEEAKSLRDIIEKLKPKKSATPSAASPSPSNSGGKRSGASPANEGSSVARKTPSPEKA